MRNIRKTLQKAKQTFLQAWMGNIQYVSQHMQVTHPMINHAYIQCYEALSPHGFEMNWNDPGIPRFFFKEVSHSGFIYRRRAKPTAGTATRTSRPPAPLFSG